MRTGLTNLLLAEEPYVNEAYVMLHLAISSLEPLSLETFMAAVNFVIKNKTIYADPEADLAPAIDILEGSEVAYLRRLVSRSGGLLEIASSVVDEATSALNNDTIQDEPKHRDSHDSGGSTLDMENPKLDLHRPKATTKIVQFLHATAKEYIQDQRDHILADRISKIFSRLNGYDLLLLCCAPWDHWVVLIKKHMFYYAKMTEMVLSGNDKDKIRGRSKIFLQIAGQCPKSDLDKCDLRWLIRLHQQQHKGRLLSLLIDHTYVNIHSYLEVILAVLANAKSLVEYMLLGARDTDYRDMTDLCLLQIAVAGPDLIPIEHSDRPTMIQILVLWGYPVDRISRLCTGKTTMKAEADEHETWTPLKVLLAGEIESDYDEDTKLAIIDCLLDQSANPNAMGKKKGFNSWVPLAHCIRYENVDPVRLLLQYGADPNFEDDYGMRPMHYALIRDDTAILLALDDHECDPLRPSHDDDTSTELALRQSILMGSIGNPMVAAFCARGLSRNYDLI